MKTILRSAFLILFLSQSVYSQNRTLNGDSLRQDIDWLQDILEEVHAGTYRYLTPTAFRQSLDRLRSQVSEGIDERTWMIKLAQTIREIRCGHTYLNPWNMNRSMRDRLFGGDSYFPLGFNIIEGEMVITENLSEDPRISSGDVIRSVNGYSAAQILDSLRTIAKTDGHNESPVADYLSLDNFDVRTWEAFDIYFNLFFGIDKAFTVEIDRMDEQRITAGLPALSKQERHTRYKGTDKEQWALSFVGDKAVLRLGTFATWKWKDFSYKDWLSDAFQRIDSAGSPHLVVDIRGNGGGLGEIGTELLSYLINEPLPCDGNQKVLARTSKADLKFKPYADTWVDWIFAGLAEEAYNRHNATYIELPESMECAELMPKADPFEGSVYVLGGPSNVSATFQLLQKVKTLDNAFFIGTETGGNQQGINGGEYIFFYLPYSKMEIDIPLKFFSNGPGKKDAGIMPDYVAQYTRSGIYAGVDPYMETVDRLIASKNQVSEAYILNLLASANWEGSLDYLDYKSNKLVSIPAALKVAVKGEGVATIDYIYPDEPHMNSSSELRLSLKENTIEGRPIESLTNRDGVLTIVANTEGEDEGQRMQLKYTYRLESNLFSIMKEEKKTKDRGYTLRNIYVFQR